MAIDGKTPRRTPNDGQSIPCIALKGGCADTTVKEERASDGHQGFGTIEPIHKTMTGSKYKSSNTKEHMSVIRDQ